MPKGKEYSTKTVKKGNTRTPMNVMGSQGKPAPLPKDQHTSRPTGTHPFPGKKASGRHMPPNHGMKKSK